MAKSEEYPWLDIKERYLAGETAKVIAEQFDGLNPAAIYQKASAEGWKREKAHMAIEVTKKMIENHPLDVARLRPDIVDELAAIGFSDIADFLTVQDDGSVRLKPFSEMPAGATRCIKVVKERRRTSRGADGEETIIDSQIEYTLLDKLKALETLAKIAGLFTDNITVNNMPQVVAIQGLNDVRNI